MSDEADPPRPDVYARTRGAPTDDAPEPPWLDERRSWFSDLKFGLFVHWGIYSQWGCIESWPLVEADTWARPDDLACWVERGRDLERFRADYRALNRTFNPVNFDPGSWADVARDAGMRYVCFTTKHHDGFCMFDTRTTDYRITGPECPFHADPRADVTRGVFDAFRARGLAVSCYFSKSDWHSPWYWDPERPAPDRNPNYDTSAEPERWERFVGFVHEQIRELMSGYGPVDVLWLDGGQVRPPSQDVRMHEIAAMARALQPRLLIADRTVGGRFEDFVTPEQEIPDAPLDRAWESCLTLGDGWSFRPGDRYKPAARVIGDLVDIASKGGNLSLNVGIAPDGSFPDEARRRLEEIGRWMRANGEGVYRSRPATPHASGLVRFTKRGRFTYAFVPRGNPTEGLASWDAHVPAGGSAVHLLGHGPVRHSVDGGRVEAGPVPATGSPWLVFRFLT